ncbi:MAG: PEP-CTERM sorting domain-containing protein [Colwellia sp.]|nr:PEP-CTERM sorting domain-containing protein [Colwellia sp.]
MIIETNNIKKISSLAGGLGLLLTSSVQAGIIYTDIPDWISDLTSGPGNNSQGFDIDGDLVNDFTINHNFIPAGAINYYDKMEAGITETNPTNKIVGYSYAFALNTGVSINSASAFNNGGNKSLGYIYDGSFYGSSYGYVIGAGDTYVGFKFDIGGDTKYGWMGLNFSANGKILSIYDYAYEDSGSGIAAGDKGISVPEPSSMAMMATGALAIAAIRRRKRKLKLN